MSAPVLVMYTCIHQRVDVCVLRPPATASGAGDVFRGVTRAQTSQTRRRRLRACLVAAGGSHSFCPLTSSAVRGNVVCKSLRYGVNVVGGWGD